MNDMRKLMEQMNHNSDIALVLYDDEETIRGSRASAEKLRSMVKQGGENTKFEFHLKHLTSDEQKIILDVIDKVASGDSEIAADYDSFGNYWIATIHNSKYVRSWLRKNGMAVRE